MSNCTTNINTINKYIDLALNSQSRNDLIAAKPGANVVLRELGILYYIHPKAGSELYYNDLLWSKYPNLTLISFNGNDELALHMCSCGNEFHRKPSVIISKNYNNPCPLCRVSHNKLTHDEYVTRLAVEHIGAELLVPYVDMHTVCLFKCSCGNDEWYSKPQDALVKKCKKCNSGGGWSVDKAKDGLLYALEFTWNNKRFVKTGIAQWRNRAGDLTIEHRLRDYRRTMPGVQIKILRVVYIESGVDLDRIEKSINASLRPIALDMPSDTASGRSETWHIDTKKTVLNIFNELIGAIKMAYDKKL